MIQLLPFMIKLNKLPFYLPLTSRGRKSRALEQIEVYRYEKR